MTYSSLFYKEFANSLDLMLNNNEYGTLWDIVEKTIFGADKMSCSLVLRLLCNPGHVSLNTFGAQAILLSSPNRKENFIDFYYTMTMHETWKVSLVLGIYADISLGIGGDRWCASVVLWNVGHAVGQGLLKSFLLSREKSGELCKYVLTKGLFLSWIFYPTGIALKSHSGSLNFFYFTLFLGKNEL